VRLAEDGKLTWISGDKGETRLSLDSIRYYVKSPNAIPLLGTYRAATAVGGRQPSWNKENDICSLSGIITGGAGDVRLGTLPIECRPRGSVLFAVAGEQGPQRIDVCDHVHIPK